MIPVEAEWSPSSDYNQCVIVGFFRGMLTRAGDALVIRKGSRRNHTFVAGRTILH